MKKKITVIALLGILFLSNISKSTLAYLTDAEGVTNHFTAKVEETEPEAKIDITLPTEYGSGYLVPVSGIRDDGTYANSIKNKVWVQCESDSDPVYVRVHVAIPAILDTPGDHENTGKILPIDKFGNKNVLIDKYSLFCFDHDTEAGYNDEWKWLDDPATHKPTYVYKDTGGMDYNIYVAVYKKVLQTDTKTTYPFIRSVYLEDAVTNGDLWDKNYGIAEVYGDIFSVVCRAEAVAITGFTDPETALTTAFGTPGTNAAYDKELWEPSGG
ncbi:MAG: hypothetical protein EOM40_07155 [Clostridia bacterium]|nr:hypothetical protein [Clostridia bacterium]NCC42340.1 hypothetical protein [Clostridia bacterium]